MMDRVRRDGLLAAIAEEEALLACLTSDRERARIRLTDLQAALATLGPEPAWFDVPVRPQASVPTTPAEKVALFRQLFRGRSDVFPRLWTNPRTGTKGYAPAWPQ
jgi:hypothetical protein